MVRHTLKFTLLTPVACASSCSLMQVYSVQVPLPDPELHPKRVAGRLVGMSRMPTVHFMRNSMHRRSTTIPAVNILAGETSTTRANPVTPSWQQQAVAHLGNAFVGKSSLLLRISDTQWIPEDQEIVTIGVDFQRSCQSWSLSNINLIVHRRKLVPFHFIL